VVYIYVLIIVPQRLVFIEPKAVACDIVEAIALRNGQITQL
jgi:hypothetical protein